MNIAIGKIGRSCYFDQNNWSIYAGDDSPKIIYEELAYRYPQHNFYLIGRSDITRYREAGGETPSNIIDLFEDVRIKFGKKSEVDAWKQILSVIEDRKLKLDFGIIMQGPDFDVSIPNAGILTMRPPHTECKCLEMAKNYAGIVIAVMNEYKFPWYRINEDPRYISIRGRDTVHEAVATLSQTNQTTPARRILGYGADSKILRDINITHEYAGIEKMFMRNMKKVDFTARDGFVAPNGKEGFARKLNKHVKKNKFIIAVNGLGSTNDRLEFIERWVLNEAPDTIIYGKWEDAAKQKHPNNFVERGIIEMQDDMWESMFTFIPSYDKSNMTKKFVTQKVWKMMYYGIIPFWDKNAYDIDNIYKDIPDYFKVATPKEMWEKINYLYDNRDEYYKYLDIIYSLLEDKYFNGDFIDETFGPLIKKYENN